MRLDLESTLTAPTTFADVSAEYDHPYTSDHLLKRGVTAAQAGDRDHARKLLTQVVALDPACEDAWMWLASISDYRC